MTLVYNTYYHRSIKIMPTTIPTVWRPLNQDLKQLTSETSLKQSLTTLSEINWFYSKTPTWLAQIPNSVQVDRLTSNPGTERGNWCYHQTAKLTVFFETGGSLQFSQISVQGNIKTWGSNVATPHLFYYPVQHPHQTPEIFFPPHIPTWEDLLWLSVSLWVDWLLWEELTYVEVRPPGVEVVVWRKEGCCNEYQEHSTCRGSQLLIASFIYWAPCT